jgi:hypothetical protein
MAFRTKFVIPPSTGTTNTRRPNEDECEVYLKCGRFAVAALLAPCVIVCLGRDVHGSLATSRPELAATIEENGGSLSP